MVYLTKQQRQALKRVWLRLPDPVPYRVFRKGVLPTVKNDDCVMVRFAGMWLGIERDGYTHS